MVLVSHQDDYKYSKESFVTGMTGSTVLHINLISLVALVCRVCLHFFLLLTEEYPQVVHRTPLQHPLALPSTQILSIPLRMVPPRRSPPPVHDPLRRPPRHPLLSAASADRAPPLRVTSSSPHPSWVRLSRLVAVRPRPTHRPSRCASRVSMATTVADRAQHPRPPPLVSPSPRASPRSARIARI
jgi:hypothetical protein